MKNFDTNFYVLIELHELNQFKIRVIRLIVERLQSICVKIFQYKISETDRIILNVISLRTIRYFLNMSLRNDQET